MKKIYLIVGAIVAVLLLGAGYFVFFKNETQLKQTVQADGGILHVDNISNSNIRIVTGQTNQIILDLTGPEKELEKVRFFKVGNDTEFELSEEWKNVRGTITVPQGTLIDLDIPDESGDDKESDFIRLGGGSTYYTINISDSGVSFNDDEPETTQYDPEADQGDDDDNGQDEDDQGGDTPPPPSPPPPPTPPEDEDDEPETTQYAPEESLDPNDRCNIELRQENRNECCQENFADSPHDECADMGYWLFNYNTRLCYYHCFHSCSIGTEEDQDECCAIEHYYDTTPPCIGEWEYGDAASGCVYQCLTEEELEEYFGDNEDNNTDAVSQFCSGHNNPDQCCDYNLKNELSIGPRPGFPDCLGRWEFGEAQSLCSFRCATHGEMLEILEQLEE